MLPLIIVFENWTGVVSLVTAIGFKYLLSLSLSMIDNLVHAVGDAVNGTPVEEPLDRAYHGIAGPRRVRVSLGSKTATFNARSSSEFHSVQDLGGEADIVEAFLDELTDEDVVWDVGAFAGWHAAFFGQVAETVAFEADPEAHRKLQETCALNPDARITPVCLGLGNPIDDRERAAVERGEGGGIADRGTDGNVTTIGRPDALLDTAFTSPTAMKLDVQGLEGEILDGFGDHLADLRAILIEVHDGRLVGDWTPETIDDRITEAGLELRRELPRREDLLRLYTADRV